MCPCSADAPCTDFVPLTLFPLLESHLTLRAVGIGSHLFRLFFRPAEPTAAAALSRATRVDFTGTWWKDIPEGVALFRALPPNIAAIRLGFVEASEGKIVAAAVEGEHATFSDLVGILLFFQPDICPSTRAPHLHAHAITHVHTRAHARTQKHTCRLISLCHRMIPFRMKFLPGASIAGARRFSHHVHAAWLTRLPLRSQRCESGSRKVGAGSRWSRKTTRRRQRQRQQSWLWRSLRVGRHPMFTSDSVSSPPVSRPPAPLVLPRHTFIYHRDTEC